MHWPPWRLRPKSNKNRSASTQQTLICRMVHDSETTTISASHIQSTIFILPRSLPCRKGERARRNAGNLPRLSSPRPFLDGRRVCIWCLPPNRSSALYALGRAEPTLSSTWQLCPVARWGGSLALHTDETYKIVMSCGVCCGRCTLLLLRIVGVYLDCQ